MALSPNPFRMKIGIAAFVFFAYATTATSGAVKETNYCGTYWRVHDGVCYYKYSKYGTLRAVMTKCDRHYAKIFKIESEEQLKFLKTWRKYDSSLWIDLYRRTEGESPGWYWGDGTPFVPTYLKWSKGLENVFAYSDFALTTQGTLVPVESWGSDYGYICEVKPAGTRGRDIPVLCSPILYHGKCPVDYKLSGGTCFFLSDLSSVTLRTYSVWSAKYKCRRKANGSQLLEIRSQKKMRAVNALITVKSPLVWLIGLRKRSYRWIWMSDSSDASSVKHASYIKWANENDNLGGKENCALLFQKTGGLRDVECHVTRSPAICVKPDTIPMFSPFTGKFGCGNTGWVRGGVSCYLVPEKLYDWDNASAVCRKSGGDLVKIASSTEAIWMRNLLAYKSAWTGLCYKDGAWRWTDGKVLENQAIKWQSEPQQRADGRASCAVVNVKGEFIAKECDDTHRYVCELREADESKCPDDWSYFNKSCYFMPTNITTWRDARYHCRALADKDHYGYLFYPSYIHEINFVGKTFLSKVVRSKREGRTPLYVWTILTDDNTGVWGYSYSRHQPIDIRHINWRKSPSEQATKNNGSFCATLTRGFLVDQPRNVTLTAVCERPLGVEPRTAEQRGEASLLSVGRWVLAACTVMVTIWAHCYRGRVWLSFVSLPM